MIYSSCIYARVKMYSSTFVLLETIQILIENEVEIPDGSENPFKKSRQ